MQKISGTFAATGAALHVGIGFVPDRVKIYNLTDASIPMIEWDYKFGKVANGAQGVSTVANGARTKLATTGIARYAGSGDEFTSDQTAYIVRAYTGNYDFAGAKSGQKMPAGFKINDTAVVNATGKECYFVAEADSVGNAGRPLVPTT
jgi:hypothetical protein